MSLKMIWEKRSASIFVKPAKARKLVGVGGGDSVL